MGGDLGGAGGSGEAAPGGRVTRIFGVWVGQLPPPLAMSLGEPVSAVGGRALLSRTSPPRPLGTAAPQGGHCFAAKTRPQPALPPRGCPLGAMEPLGVLAPASG